MYCVVNSFLVSLGGGAIEMELSKYLRDFSRTIAGKEQLIIASVAKSLEVIPRQLCDNAGFDSTNILNRLRQLHSQGMESLDNENVHSLSHKGKLWYGVDITREDVADNFEACVWEPAVVKINAITGAIEAATLILSVDETIRNPKSSSEPSGPLPTRGRGTKPRRDVP